MTHWYCIYTKSKYEDHVTQRLTHVPGIEILNPKLKTQRFIRGRLRHVTEELFPSYIFARFNPDDSYSLIKYTRGIRRIIGDRSGRPYIVDDEIIRQIQARIEDGFVRIRQPVLQTGDHVVIHEGPLKGLTGMFRNHVKARDRVLILLNTIGYQASLEIDKGYLAKA